MIFGLPFIPHEEIENTFVEAVMSEAPVDARCTKVADCLMLFGFITTYAISTYHH
jgi:hypothetical protein